MNDRLSRPRRGLARWLLAMLPLTGAAGVGASVTTGVNSGAHIEMPPAWLLSNMHCSATLITPRVALTAQRCVEGWPHHSFRHRGTDQWQTGVAVTYSRQLGPLGDLALVLFDAPFGGGMPTTVPIPSYRLEQRLLSDPVPMTGERIRTTLAVYGQDHDPGGVRTSARRRTTYVADTEMPLIHRSFAGIRAWRTSDDLYRHFFFPYSYFWQSAATGLHASLYETPAGQGGLAFSDSDTDDLIVGLTGHTAGWGRFAVSPIDAGDRGGAILATRQVGEWLVSTVSGTVGASAAERLLALGLQDADGPGNARRRGAAGEAGAGHRPLGRQRSPRHPRRHPCLREPVQRRCRVLPAGGVRRRGPLLVLLPGKTDNLHWEYLGTDLPEKLQATTPVHAWGENDFRGTVGDVFIHANPYSNRVEYFRLKALDSDQRYWLLPRDAGDTFWWTYLGTDLPTRTLRFVE
ncbi:hypothetical protein ACFJIX_09885 [Roseateles sp. UC29_93]|uniref:hypothetical protein n=1 Tax=Roseateles sp. UC29_93 TaxID=3350177 RepID=UPI00366BEA2F